MVLFASALAGRPITLADPPPQRNTLPPPDTLWRPPPQADWPAQRLALLRQLVCATPAHAAAAEAAAARPLLARLYRLLRAAQADARVAQRFPGAAPALHQARDQVLRGMPPRRCLLRRRLDRLQQLLLGAPMQADDAWAAPAAVAAQPEAGADSLLQVACVLLARLDPRHGPRGRRGLPPAMLEIRELQGTETAGGPGGQGQTGEGGDEASAPAGGAGPAPPRPAQAQPIAGGSAAAAADDVPADAVPGEPPTVDALPLRTRPRATPGTVVAHDEWDFRARRYRPAWAWVHELRPAAKDLQFLAQLRQRHGLLTQRIRRRIAHVRAAQRERLHRSPDGEEIDLDAAIEARAERRAGRAGEGRVYTGHQPARRDVCAAFLLDISGSTGFQVPDPAAALPESDEDAYFHAAPARAWQVPLPRRRVIDVAHDAIGLMCDALAQLGDRHAVYGFSGEGRQRVEFHRAKDFDEPWSARSAAALAAMQPSGSTRTGAALRHATRQLARQPARTRFLILVTDGYPQDSDYGDRPDDLDYGLRDTAMALREAERQGIAAFCVCIDHAAHDHLRRVCPPARYMVIDEVDALPLQLSKVYRQLVGGLQGSSCS